MFADSLFVALGNILGALYFIIAIFVYVALIRSIGARSRSEHETKPKLGFPEALLAAGLIAFLLFASLGSSEANLNQLSRLNSQLLLINLVVELGIVGIIAFFLVARGFSLDVLGGFSKVNIARAISVAVVLLILAYPLIAALEMVTQSLFEVSSSRQPIVELFTMSGSIRERALVIVIAIAAAPPIEEFLFRFFIYGVLRRYLGWTAGAVLNALLFATVHTHLPSFMPLFVLGLCLTIAYESTGSILVSMTMHALFNAASLTLLAFPDMVPQ
jgi:CAAX protease family protein